MGLGNRPFGPGFESIFGGVKKDYGKSPSHEGSSGHTETGLTANEI
jgi:hypothetical protein